MARTRTIQRWRHNMEVRDDVDYVNILATLSEGRHPTTPFPLLPRTETNTSL